MAKTDVANYFIKLLPTYRKGHFDTIQLRDLTLHRRGRSTTEFSVGFSSVECNVQWVITFPMPKEATIIEKCKILSTDIQSLTILIVHQSELLEGE